MNGLLKTPTDLKNYICEKFPSLPMEKMHVFKDFYTYHLIIVTPEGHLARKIVYVGKIPAINDLLPMRLELERTVATFLAEHGYLSAEYVKKEYGNGK